MSTYSQISRIPNFIQTLIPLITPPTLSTLSEVGIFSTLPPAEETSLTAIRQENNALGLASWSLNALYVEAKLLLQANNSDLNAASVILLACPDYTTAWNVRKRCVIEDSLEEELHFSKLVLLRSPKSAEAWAHRAWVLRRFGFGKGGAQEELELAWVLASRVKSNYYVGVHRLRALDGCEEDEVRGELKRSRKWLMANISDSSGWWYQKLLLARIEHDVTQVWTEELAYVRQMTERYGDEYQCVAGHLHWVRGQKKVDWEDLRRGTEG